MQRTDLGKAGKKEDTDATNDLSSALFLFASPYRVRFVDPPNVLSRMCSASFDDTQRFALRDQPTTRWVWGNG
jgi:hypothetical protein